MRNRLLGLRKAYSRILWEQLEENSWATRQSSWHRQGRPRRGPLRRELARARGITTAGGRRVSQARKADLLVALA